MSLWERALRLVIILIVIAGLIIYNNRIPEVIRYLLITFVFIMFLSLILAP